MKYSYVNTFKSPAYPPCTKPSSIVSRQAWCWGMFGAVFFAFCFAMLRNSRDLEMGPSLFVMWRDLTKGFLPSAMSKARKRAMLSNSCEGTIASIRPSSSPSSDVIGFEDYKKISDNGESHRIVAFIYRFNGPFDNQYYMMGIWMIYRVYIISFLW